MDSDQMTFFVATGGDSHVVMTVGFEKRAGYEKLAGVEKLAEDIPEFKGQRDMRESKDEAPTIYSDHLVLTGEDLIYSEYSPGQAGGRMSEFIARWALLGTMIALAVEPTGATRPFSPMGSPHYNLDSVAPAQGTAISYGGLVLEWVKVLAVCLALLLLAWRIWGIIKNSEAWRNLNILGGENPAAEVNEEVAADNDRLLDNHPHSDMELTNRRIAAPNPPASSHRVMQHLPGFPNFHDEGRSQAYPGASAGSKFTRVWTCTSSSMSIHESHNSHSAFTRNS